MAMQWLGVIGLAAGLATAVPAAAVTTQFFASGTWGPDVPVTGHSAPGANFSVSFTLSTPLPPDAAPGGAYEVVNPVLSFFIMDGVPNLDPLEQVIFYNAADGGLFDLIYAVDNINLFGVDVGSTGTLSYGIFAVDFGIDGQRGLGAGTLGITAVPEPASWALMIAGFGATGLVLRRRQPATA